MTRAPMATQPAAPIKPKRARAKKAVAAPAAETVIHSIKGFDANLQCRGFQFKEGETYEHTGPIKACKSGFHACTLDAHPFEVFAYYPPAGSRFHLVEQRGETNSDDSIKIASAKITIGYELSIGELTKRAVEWVFARSKPQGAASATGGQGAASATGGQGAASATGEQGAASAIGTMGAAMSSGYGGTVTGSAGNALFAVERDNSYNIISVAAGIVGKDGIEPGAIYRCAGGKLVKA
jgi:hypothetical protein